MNVNIQVKVNLYPTEDLEQVKVAAQKLFPIQDMRVINKEENMKVLIFKSGDINSLSNFKAILKQDRIRTAVRRALYHSIENDEIRFYLNKQVAYAGHISICEALGESPLGPIEVKIKTDEPESLVEWIVPNE